MTIHTTTLPGWAIRPLGRLARVVIAGAGLAIATAVLTAAAAVETGSWALILLGVGLAAFSVRAARYPTVSRLVPLGVIAVAVPLTLLFI